MTETPIDTPTPTVAPLSALARGKICPRCATMFAPCEWWRCGCPACGKVMVWATPFVIAKAVANRKREGWKGNRRTRNRVPL
jgi:hypothetical protein